MAAEKLIRQFERMIVPELFPKNDFMARAINDDGYVNGNSVDIQNSGTIPDVLVDTSTYPIPVSRRTDVAHQYILENLNTEVTHIPTVEELTEIGGRNKMNSIATQQASKIRTKAADRCIVNWLTGLPAGQKVATTGAARNPSVPVATGQRKQITAEDVRAGLEILAADDVIMEGDSPVMVVNSAFYYNDLLGIDDFVRYDSTAKANPALNNGLLGNLYGVEVYMRSRVATVDASFDVKAEGAAGAATDAGTAILYHPNYVRRAVGAFKVYIETDKPQYAGDIMSTELRFGSVRSRNDDKGVIQIYEATV